MSAAMREPFEQYAQDIGTHVMKTAFVPTQKGHVDICVENVSDKSTVVSMRMLTGALAKDFTQVAQREHLDPIVAELRAVEDVMKEYRNKQTYLTGNENVTRHVVDSIHRRVLLLAAVNIATVIFCSTTTVLFLKAFFRAKKII